MSQRLRRSPAWGFPALLVLYLAWLLFRAWQARNLPAMAVDLVPRSTWDAFAWLRGLVRRELVVLGLYFLLGLLTPPATGRWIASGIRSRRGLLWLAWFVFGLATIATCSTIAWSAPPPVGTLLLPVVCYLAGVRLSAAAQGGPRPFARAAAQLGGLLLLLVATAGVATRMAVSAAPLDFDATATGADAKRQLAQRIRATRLPDDQPQQLQLADTEINALLASALGFGSDTRQARVQFAPSSFAARVSLALPREREPGQFLNLQMAGRLAISDGRLDLGIQEMTLGRLAAPGLLLQTLSSSLYAMLMDDPQTRRIIQAVMKLNLNPGTMDLSFQPGALGRQVVPSLAQLLWARPDVAVETGIYLGHLLGMFPGLPAEADRLGLMMQGAFALAAERSEHGDPVRENRAALLALAILLGHPDLEPFVGELLDPGQKVEARQMIGSVALRGRQDWARHFLVSAALVLLSDEPTSDRIGLLKEQLDAQDGGSGFSFADKLANFAGTRLATAAIRDEAGARNVQARLAAGFDVDALFPPADGLTEGISAAEFQDRYGGLEGAGYRQAIDEINRRLSLLPPL